MHRDVSAIASWGTYGKLTGNCRRDMLRRHCRRSGVPRPISMDVSVWKRYRVDVVAQSILSPLDVMESIWKSHPAQFERFFVPTSPRSFWDQVHPDDPRLVLLDDLRRRPNWKDKAIPFALHGDGAQFTKKNSNSLQCAQWKSMLTENSENCIFRSSASPKIARSMWKMGLVKTRWMQCGSKSSHCSMQLSTVSTRGRFRMV